MTRFALVGVVAFVFGCSLTPARANPDTPLRTASADLAKSIKKVLDGEKQSAVAVGDFDGPAALNSRFGPGLRTALVDELTRSGLTVDAKADLTLTGSYAIAEEVLSGEPQLVIKVSARLLDRNGKELVMPRQKIPPARITDNKTIARITGATLSLPPLGDKATRNEAIRKALRDPGVFIDGTKVSSKAGASLAVEVFLKPTAGAAVARSPKAVNGQATVALAGDESFELRLHNANKYEGAVTISIDGVDAFQFSKSRDPMTGYPRLTHFLAPPEKSITIPGWHVTNDPAVKDGVLPFRIESNKWGGWFNLPRGKVGVITVTYAYAAHTKEQLVEYDGVRGVIDMETGFAPGLKADAKEETRLVGAVREVVSIRYSH